MSNQPDKKPKTLIATCVMNSDTLAKAYELSIENGKVVHMREITKDADMPAIAIALATTVLWEGFRQNNDKVIFG